MAVAYINTPDVGNKTGLDAFVDDINSNLAASGFKVAVRAATTAALDAHTATGALLRANANGALAAQDGITLAVGDRLLVKNEGASNTSAVNLVYTVDQLGSASTPWVLRRATDFDVSAEIGGGTWVKVDEGTENGGRNWYISNDIDPFTLGTTAIRWQVAPESDVTLGDSLQIKTHFGFALSEFRIRTAAIQTTDGSATTLWTLTLGNGESALITVYLQCRTDGTVATGTEVYGGFVHRTAVRRVDAHVAGARYVVGGGTGAPGVDDVDDAEEYESRVSGTVESGASLNGAFNLSGNDVRYQVTGLAGVNMNWVATIMYQIVGDNA